MRVSLLPKFAACQTHLVDGAKIDRLLDNVVVLWHLCVGYTRFVSGEG